MSRTTVSWQEEQLQEVELCTALSIASWGSERSLTQAEVDQLLGVRPRARGRVEDA